MHDLGGHKNGVQVGGVRLIVVLVWAKNTRPDYLFQSTPVLDLGGHTKHWS